jgi:hypothetical protein
MGRWVILFARKTGAHGENKFQSSFSSGLEQAMPARFDFGPATAIGYAAGFERSCSEVLQSIGWEQPSCRENRRK